jgi:hypothetical protein
MRSLLFQDVMQHRLVVCGRHFETFSPCITLQEGEDLNDILLTFQVKKKKNSNIAHHNTKTQEMINRKLTENFRKMM